MSPGTVGPTGSPAPPPGSSLLSDKFLFPSRQQIIEGDSGDAGPRDRREMRLQGLLEGGTSRLTIWGVGLTLLHEKGQRWMLGRSAC